MVDEWLLLFLANYEWLRISRVIIEVFFCRINGWSIKRQMGMEAVKERDLSGAKRWFGGRQAWWYCIMKIYSLEVQKKPAKKDSSGLLIKRIYSVYKRKATQITDVISIEC